MARTRSQTGTPRLASGRALLLGIGAALSLALLAFGCVSPQGGWDVGDLEKRYPALSRFSGSRLGDAPPYFLPANSSGFTLFLCRWEKEQTLRVSLPAAATERQREIVRTVLAAWQELGLGLRFEPVERGPADIEIELFEADDPAFVQGRTGDTIADCALPPLGGTSATTGRVAARLVYASIYIRSSNLDNLGRPEPLSDTRLAGELLHEIGHALGYPGHAAYGDSLMVREHEVSNHWGERVLAGEPLREPSLEALYALPNGTIVGEQEIEPVAMDSILRFAQTVEPAQWPGPFVRVGESAAQLYWRQPASRWRGVFDLEDWRRRLRDGRETPVTHNRLVGRILERGLRGAYRGER